MVERAKPMLVITASQWTMAEATNGATAPPGGHAEKHERELEYQIKFDLINGIWK